MNSFNHPALDQQKTTPLIYTAFSKHLFYFRSHISQFVLTKNGVPLNPFMLFDYFLLDSIDRNIVRNANNCLVKRADAIWVFGSISDGVFAEMLLAKERSIPLSFFKITSQIISPCSIEELAWEKEVESHAEEFTKCYAIDQSSN